jgi:hypothetical protein
VTKTKVLILMANLKRLIVIDYALRLLYNNANYCQILT